jgi:hypothetical protein
MSKGLPAREPARKPAKIISLSRLIIYDHIIGKMIIFRFFSRISETSQCGFTVLVFCMKNLVAVALVKLLDPIQFASLGSSQKALFG